MTKIIIIALLLMGCNGEDNTYTRMETCTVDHITEDIITLECNGIYRDAYSDGKDYYVGQPVTATIEEYVEIQEWN